MTPFGDERQNRLQEQLNPETAERIAGIALEFEPVILSATFWNCYAPWNVPERRICDNFFYMTVSGEERVTVEGKERLFRRGDIMIVPEYVPHSFGLTPGCTESSHFIAHALQENQAGENPFAGFTSPFLRPVHPDAVIGQLHTIVALRNTNPDAAFSLTRQLLRSLMIEETMAGRYAPVPEPHGDERIAAALKFIANNLTGTISVKDIASHVKLGEVRFRHIFREATGLPPAAYLLRSRLLLAARLLARYELSLNEVAEQSGFSSESYLCTAFKQALGRTPGEYRRYIRIR